LGGHTSDNLNRWLSEYPLQRFFITHPLRIGFFTRHPPPQEENDEWNRLIAQIDLDAPE
jgi:hypothetical protein